ncbi:phage baseplate assembly protein V [Candidatus Termititenax aidoneus]|uniref:Phage baseplate assembly protein V n=1 Tax=Termititenax aidoneus TaxID=2218524 RepID=A0A388TBH1_TERA1|nr:phage baseplate assembly protein V [Candidatus Termititenax aidoneus]
MLENVFGDNFANSMKRFEQIMFSKLNCISIGRIENVNFAEQTVTARIVYKRVYQDSTIKDYPLLLDVPFFVLQGGGNYIGLPIKSGDYCIVLFCDRNFSTWWDSGAEKEPESERKHSLSDGIAICGINPKSSPLGYDGQSVLWKLAHALEIDTPENAEIKAKNLNMIVEEKIKLANSSTDLLTLLSGLIDIIKGITTFGSPTSQQVSPASQQQLDQYKTTLEQLLEAAGG